MTESALHVEVASSPPQGWDAYVERHPDHTVYHRAAAVLVGARAFGLRTTFLAARDSQQALIGVLPLVEQSSFLFGRFLVSVPFFTYGGILSDNVDGAVALAARASELARARRADHLELRHMVALSELRLAERLDKVSMMLPLPASVGLLSKQLGAKLRSQIRRADRENPVVVWGGEELLPEFHEVFASSMHELGTPVYPRRFFEIACQAFAGSFQVLVVRVQGRAEAVAIIVRHGRRVEVPWAAASAAAKRGAVNMRMYWEMLSRAIEVGADTFDFGRSSVESGTYRFKAQWGAKPVQLHWHYWLPPEKRIPQLNQGNPKYARAAAAWRKLPLWCANLIGPHIVRHLP